MINEYPSSDGILIPGRRGHLLGHLYLPGGSYPRPVVLIAHGIPGNERLFDFSVYLREHGFCTVNFHYSGSWGSDGNYSVPNCFEDTDSAVEYILRNENGWFDLDNFFFVGHSMGGLMGAHAISAFDAVRGGVLLAPFNLAREAQSVLTGKHGSFLEDLFTDGVTSSWLKNFSREDFVRHLTRTPERFDLISYVPALSGKNILIVTGSRDTVCPAPGHGCELALALKNAGGPITHKEFDTDHCFNTSRAEIREAVTDYLISLTSPLH